ncbi:putative disease resistance protein [Camellia lanceoleosa]|uniref:Disease resistance protein n=1 Tax=Camellia lanceoleosa TaxID=1840588 RepID=A0ACC0IS63_9ERIC|nr:putative disease resistance protein [Camellia lanceoleosa]
MKMECIVVKEELLTEEEALNPFMSKVEGHQTVLTSKVKEIATKVAKECACLPVAIITLAGSMRGVNDIHEWRNALNELISSTKQITDKESGRFKLLELSFAAIQSLLESISKLENLYALLLENCRQLNYVPSLEKLKALKELKLTESQIEEVPQGIEELTSLRNLNLSPNYSLRTFPCWKLRRLSQLQCLRIKRTKVEVSSKELLGLTQLKVLEAQFHSVQELTYYVTSLQCQSLENYNLVVGIVDKKDQDDEQEKYYPEATEVCIYNSKYFRSTGVGHVTLPSNIEYLNIRRWDYHISLSDIQLLRDVRDLRRFIIED